MKAKKPRIYLSAEFYFFDRSRILSHSPVWRGRASNKLLIRLPRSGVSVQGEEDGLWCLCITPATASPRLMGRELIHIDRDAADTRSKLPAPITMATKSPNTCPHTLGTSLNQAAGQQLWSQCVTLTAGDSFYDAQVIFGPL